MSFNPYLNILLAESSTYFESATLSEVTISDMSITVPDAGKYRADFNGQFETVLTSVTAQASIDLTALISDINSELNTDPMPAFTTGTTIYAGVYDTAAAVSPTGTITLDGGGDVNALFIFRTSAGAIAAGASTVFILTNGASSNNIFFLAAGAITIGATSDVVGTFISDAAVTIGAGTTLEGRALSVAGAVSIDTCTISVPPLPYPYTMGLIENFVMFTSSGAVSNTGISTITGDIGTDSGAITGFATATIVGVIYYAGQFSSLFDISFFIDGVIQPISTRERENATTKEEITTVAVIDVTANQVIDVRVQNSVGISKFYNRALVLTQIQEII